MKIMLPLVEYKQDSCKEWFLSICCIDNNNHSLTEIEAGLMQGLLAKYYVEPMNIMLS